MVKVCECGHDDVDVGPLGLTHLKEYEPSHSARREQDRDEGWYNENGRHADFVAKLLLLLRLDHTLQDSEKGVTDTALGTSVYLVLAPFVFVCRVDDGFVLSSFFVVSLIAIVVIHWIKR